MLRPHSDEEKEFIKYLVKKHAREPFWKRRIFSYILIIAVAIILTTVILVAYPTEENQYIPSSTFDEFGWSETSAINAAEKVIQEQLAFPSSAQFSNEKAALKSENVSFNEYKVTGTVESLNPYGFTVKKSFYVTLRCFANSDYEVVESDIF